MIGGVTHHLTMRRQSMNKPVQDLISAGQFDLIVVVRVNSDCGVGCSYCAFSRDVVRPRSKIDDKLLFALGNYLQQLQATNHKRVLVSWLGGEPFQWPHWRKHTEHFAESLGLAVSLTTNGLALTSPSLRGDILRWLHELTISLDGVAEYHDAIRRLPGMYRRVEKAVRSLHQERGSSAIRLRVNTVLTRHNITDFGSFCEQMNALGIDEITFNQLGGNDRPEFFPHNRLRPEDIHRFMDELPALSERLGKHGTTLQHSSTYLERILATTENRAMPINDCQPGTRLLFVDELGWVGPCSFTASSLGLHLFDLMNYTWHDVNNFFRTRLQQISPNACHDCHATHVFDKFSITAH